MLNKLTCVLVILLSHWGLSQIYEGASCKHTFTQNVGRCVNMERCKSAKQDFLTSGMPPTFCGTNNNSKLVCCEDDKFIQATSTSPPSTSLPAHRSIRQALDNRFNSNRRPGIISLEKCQSYSSHVIVKVPFVALGLHSRKKEINKAKCEYRSTELIVGGQKADPGEFPHMAAIGWKTSSGNYDFNCGGSLISERFVLSAGHCTNSGETHNPIPEIVRLGDLNLDPNVEDGVHPIEIPIKNIHKHPEYNPPSRYNDIALFELENSVTFNNHIRPACVWTDSDFGDNEKAVATGWGADETGKKSNDLLKVSLSIMDNRECNVSLSYIINRKWSHGFVETQMCAGETRVGKDTCLGDSGSPLQVVTEENRCIFKVLGITSFGSTTCGNNPAVYTKVSSYLGWIESVVWADE